MVIYAPRMQGMMQVIVSQQTTVTEKKYQTTDQVWTEFDTLTFDFAESSSYSESIFIKYGKKMFCIFLQKIA